MTTNRTTRDSSHLLRTLAIAEVMAVFALVHVSYRSLQSFTDYGRWEAVEGVNFLTGATMIFATLGLLCVRKVNLRTYGLSLKNWKTDLRIGQVWFLVAGLVGGALAYLFDVRTSFSGRNPPTVKLGFATLTIKVAVVILFAIVYRRKLPNVPRPASVFLLVSLFVLTAISPLFAAVHVDAPLLPVFLDLLWMGVFAGIGEEMFFRGYVQSRVNEAWGRPWKVLGVRFGVGLIVSSVLFGFIHALNSVDYFRGQFSFAWGYGLMTVGILAAVIRERTSSIWPCVVMHVLGNILGRTAALLTGAT